MSAVTAAASPAIVADHHSDRAGINNGSETDVYGTSSDPRTSTADARNRGGPAAAVQAHHRQRGDGRDPVGVSSRMKPSRAGQAM